MQEQLAGVPSSAPADVNTTFGVLFIGFIFAVTLYGLTFFQVYVFYSRFPNEDLWVKCMVAVLCAIDTVITALVSQIQYFYLITNFLIPWERLPATHTLAVEKGLAVLGIFIVQCYYAARVLSLTNKNIFASTSVVLLALGSLAAAVQLSHRQFISALVTPSMKVVMGLNEGFSTACDAVILVALYYCLRAARHPEMKTPTGIFDRLVVFLVNRGTSFTIYQAVLLLVFLTSPNSQVWILFHFVASKIHINSLLSLLNSRKVSRGRGLNEEENVAGRGDRDNKDALQIPSARNVRVAGLNLDIQREQAVSIELSPMTPRTAVDMFEDALANRAKSSMSMESATLRDPNTPISMKAPSFTIA